MQDNILYKFPILTPKWRLHLSPDGGTVIGKRLGEPISNEMLSPLKIPNSFYINKTATDIFRLCDGTLNVCKIIEKVCGNNGTNFESGVRSIIPFLEEAVRRNHLQLSNSPYPIDINITGSSEYYFPIHMAIEITSSCNLYCQHCYQGGNESKKENKLSTSQLLVILGSLADQGVAIVELTGGEPLMHPDFFTILEFCAKHFVLFAVLTNGVLLDEKSVDIIAKYKENLIVSVSLDSSNSEFHDKFRGIKGSFEKTISAIKYLSEKGVFTRVAMSITQENFYDVENTLILSKKLGAKLFTYSPVLPFGRGERIEWHCSYTKEMLEYQVQIHEKHRSFLSIISEESKKYLEKKGNCGAGYRGFVLDPLGNVRPCVMSPNEGSMIIGNITNQSTEEIFKNPIVQYLHDLPSPTEKICGDCSFLPFCKHCFLRGIYKFKEENKNCIWVKKNDITKWLSG